MIRLPPGLRDLVNQHHRELAQTWRSPWEADNERTQLALVAEPEESKPVSSLRCDHCGTPYTPSNGRQRYCTPKCNAAVKLERRKPTQDKATCVHVWTSHGVKHMICKPCGSVRGKGKV